MKKSAKEILVKFCQLKSRKIGQVLNIPLDFYWNKKDTKWLRNLSEDDCKMVLEELEKNKNDFGGLWDSSCVPCILLEKVFPSCSCCYYGENHEICDNHYKPLSDWKYIKNLFKEDNLDEFIVLSNDFYNKILKDAKK